MGPEELQNPLPTRSISLYLQSLQQKPGHLHTCNGDFRGLLGPTLQTLNGLLGSDLARRSDVTAQGFHIQSVGLWSEPVDEKNNGGVNRGELNCEKMTQVDRRRERNTALGNWGGEPLKAFPNTDPMSL